MAFCLLVSLLPMQPSAVALPNSQPVGASGEASRVVPIFNSANSHQALEFAGVEDKIIQALHPNDKPNLDIPVPVVVFTTNKEFQKEITILMPRTNIPIDGFRFYSSIAGVEQPDDFFPTQEVSWGAPESPLQCKFYISGGDEPYRNPSSCKLPISSFTNQFKFESGNSIRFAAESWVGYGPPSKPLEMQLCSKYVFIGMRGSGEKYEADPLGIGKTLTELFYKVRVHPKIDEDILVDGVPDYKAVPVPGTSGSNFIRDPSILPTFISETMDTGPQHLAQRFNKIMKTCPSSKFVLAGYSQGAYAVHDLVQSWEKEYGDKVRNLISGVFLIANPAEVIGGIIPTLDAYNKSDPAKAAAFALCFRDDISVTRNLKQSWGWIKDSPKKVWDFVSRKKSPDENYNQESIDTKNEPWCQVYWTLINLTTVERRLGNLEKVKSASYFKPGDIVADFCKLIPNPNATVATNMCFLQGNLPTKPTPREASKLVRNLNVILLGVAKGLQVKKAIDIHSSYASDPTWAPQLVNKVFGELP